MKTWSVWTFDQDGEKILVTNGLTERQARDIVKHLRNHSRDFEVLFEKD